MVNEWNKSALVGEFESEFETMLRRRLRSGAAPVAACAGFDPDAASAYLEGAVGGSHRAGYESHLAGCVTCRRHLIELARLAQCEPLAEVQPVSAPDRIPVWGRLKETVAAWFDISSRGFKWQIASATGAVFAILIAALGVQAW
ncbi:MAG TPA: zf-HC2 domain-containing protein, partial [Blastocatellia bacterium]